MKAGVMEAARNSLRLSDDIVLAVRSTGGFKYREKMPGSNQDRDLAGIRGVTLVYEAFIKVAILEDMLKSDSFVDRTFELYEARFHEVVDALNTEGAGRKKV